MAEGSADVSRRGHATICLPIEKDEYDEIVENPKDFRQWLDRCFAEMPELFPQGFSQGYVMKDGRISVNQGEFLRRIGLRNGRFYSIRPSFLVPYMTARTEEVEGPLFLRKFGVPFWALARVFDRDPMYWYRLEMGLGRNSLVGTTVRTVELPVHLLADEHHTRRDGEKNYIATTVGGGAVLGAALSEGAGSDDLKEAYGVFKEEAQDIEPEYVPNAVNTDGWHGTQAALKTLFPLAAILRCFLHAWLKKAERNGQAPGWWLKLAGRKLPEQRAAMRRVILLAVKRAEREATLILR